MHRRQPDKGSETKSTYSGWSGDSEDESGAMTQKGSSGPERAGAESHVLVFVLYCKGLGKPWEDYKPMTWPRFDTGVNKSWSK